MKDEDVEFEVVWSGKDPLLPPRPSKTNPIWETLPGQGPVTENGSPRKDRTSEISEEEFIDREWEKLDLKESQIPN